MFCEKCGKEIGENLPCECEKQNKAESHLSVPESAYLPWVYILASVWCMVIGEVFVLTEVMEFVLLGLVKWFFGGGWLSLLVYFAFVALCAYLDFMCEDIGFEKIFIKDMESSKRALIAKIGKVCVKVLDVLTILLVVTGAFRFYQETGTLFSRGILLNAKVFKAIQLSFISIALEVIPTLFSVGTGDKGSH